MKPTSNKFFTAILLPLAVAMLFSSCATERTVKSVKPGKYVLDDKYWSKKEGTTTTAQQEEGKKKLMSRFANRGFSKDPETGDLSVTNKNLYAGQKSRAGNKAFGGRKEARLAEREAEKKIFDTPEYLKRSAFQEGKKSARETGQLVNKESRFADQFGRVESENAGFLSRINPFDRKKYADGNQAFSTFNNRDVSNAPSPLATGVARTKGFQDDVKMTVDDVKKMLNPNAYANAKGL